MNNEMNDFLDFEEFESLKKRYKQLRKGEISNAYFDVLELEGLLDYYIEESNIDDTKYLLQLAEKQHPGTISLDIRRAKFLFSEGRFNEAYSLIDRLEQLESSNHEVFLIKGLTLVIDKRIKEAKQAFQKAIELAEDELDEIYYTIATALESARQYKEAMRYFKKAYLASDKKDYDLLYDLAYCSQKAGYYDDSIRYYQQYLDVNTFSESAWYNLGVNYHALEKFQKALEAFEYALTIEPEYILAIYGTANAYVRLERWEEAVVYYEKAMKLNNEEDAESLCEIGECYRMLSNNEKALEYFQRSLTLDANYSDANFGIGVMMYDIDEYSTSITYLKKAIKTAPYNPDYWYALGVTYSEVNLFPEANEAFERTVKLYPYDAEIWLTYAELQYNHGNIEKAIKLLNEGLVSNKDSAVIQYRLAAYYLNKNDEAQGFYYLSKAVKSDKNKADVFFEAYNKEFGVEAVQRILSE